MSTLITHPAESDELTTERLSAAKPATQKPAIEKGVRTRGPATAPRRRREVLRPAGRASAPRRGLLPGAWRSPGVDPQRGWLHQPVRIVEPTPELRLTRPLTPAELAPRPAQAPTPLRLTRRGRLVATTLIVGSFLALTVAVAGPGTPEPISWGATQTHVVAPGESLWGIARAAHVDAPTREVVDRIEELNGLDSAMLVPGQQIEVPVAG